VSKYAEEADLTSYLEGAGVAEPASVAWWLTRAEQQVDRMLLTAVYDVDLDGLPTDDAVAEALKQATLAQAHYMLVVNDPTGSKDRYASYSIGSVSVSRGAATSGATSSSAYSPVAQDILRSAGLLPGYVQAWW
jgi:hypothetical protein